MRLLVPLLLLAATLAVFVSGREPVAPKTMAIMKKVTKGFRRCTCWWDITKHNCACCKKSTNPSKFSVMQCGWPMHRYCHKNFNDEPEKGCPGINNRQFTRSQRGYPCFWDPENTKCAWCVNKEKVGVQCAPSKNDPNLREGRCVQPKLGLIRRNKETCESSVRGDCFHIQRRDPNSECKMYRLKNGRKPVRYELTCKDGYKGNGIQCRNKETGLISPPNGGMVEFSATITHDFIMQAAEGTFPLGPSTDNMFRLMKDLADGGTCADCNATMCTATKN